MRIEKEANIERSPEDVFDFLANSENMPRWRTDLQDVRQISEGPPQKGATYSFVRTRPHVESTVQWVEFVRPRLLGWQGAKTRLGPGSLQFSGTHTLTPRDGGTHLSSVFLTEFSGLLKVVTLLRAGAVRRELAENYETLKRLLEAENRIGSASKP